MTQIRNPTVYTLKRCDSIPTYPSPSPSPSPPPPRPIHFPTSPPPDQPAILHFTHSHPLSQLIHPDPFTCSGCKEYGAGNRFSCQQCDFQLHDFCALSPPILNNHPLHPRHQLFFHPKPKTGAIYWPKCNICAKSTKGFTFRCNPCNFQIHPCCAMLSNHITFPLIHPHALKLLLAPAASEYFICGECRRRRGGHVYACMLCNYHLHAVCAKDMINGLQANGINKTNNTTTPMLGPAVRLASQAVIEFIGGLIEGIGDGVGQALIQNIARGKRSRSRSRRAVSKPP